MLNITITAYPHSWGAYTIVPNIFYTYKAAAVLLIGGFCSEHSPLNLISSCVPWCSHQLMNGVWKELNHPLPLPNVFFLNRLPCQLLMKLQYCRHSLQALPTVEKVA